MVAKINRGKNLYGVLMYNQRKVDKANGEVLWCGNMPVVTDKVLHFHLMLRFFEPYLAANQKTEKPILHISLNPDPDDKVSDNQFIRLARTYMQEMGYGNQPYIVYKHSDIERAHLHIVSVCVDESGKKINDHFEQRRSMDVCRKMERDFNLLPAVSKKAADKNQVIFKPVDYSKGAVKSQIAAVVRYLPDYYKFFTLGEYNALLALFNITAEQVEGVINGEKRTGLIYISLDKEGTKTGTPLKASLFGRSAGLKALTAKMNTAKEAGINQQEKKGLYQSVYKAFQKADSEKQFKALLAKQGTDIFVRRNDTGRIYGVTFIDHNTRSVWNGSRISKNLSANNFNKWWALGQKPDILSVDDQSKSGASDFKQANITTGNGFGSMSGSTILSDIFNVFATGDQNHDYEEEAFLRQMKKRRKRRGNA